MIISRYKNNKIIKNPICPVEDITMNFKIIKNDGNHISSYNVTDIAKYDITKYEIELELDRCETYILNDKRYNLNRGDICIRIPNDSLVAVPSRRSYILQIDLKSNAKKYANEFFMLRNLIQFAYREGPVICPDDVYSILKIYNEFMRIIDADFESALHLVFKLVYLICAGIHQSLYNRSINNDNIYDTIVQYMKTHADKNIKLCDLAKLAHMDESYFSKLFKKKFGKTPMRMLHDVRMDKALDMVLYTDIRICEIALRCGYNTTAFFISEYKKKFGMTPNKYRVQNRKLIKTCADFQ